MVACVGGVPWHVVRALPTAAAEPTAAATTAAAATAVTATAGSTATVAAAVVVVAPSCVGKPYRRRPVGDIADGELFMCFLFEAVGLILGSGRGESQVGSCIRTRDVRVFGRVQQQ